jgi:O-antigen/teichoic acid export membrane protein
MPEIRRNIAANLVSQGWIAAIGLVFPPLYVRVLGIESYGLIGFFSSLTMVLGVLDFGLSATLNREMARLSADTAEDVPRAMRDLVRTFEVLFWTVGAIIGGMVILLAPLIARRWVNARDLPVETITQAVRVMGLIFAFQWPFGIYNGGLVGLQRQIEANGVFAFAMTLKAAGAAAVIVWVSPSIKTFFAWQVATTVVQTAAARAMLMRALPHHCKPGAFRRDVLFCNWKFSAGMSGVSLLAVALTQVDKILLSKLLSLAEFGYYTLAYTVGRSLSYLVSPVCMAIYPRLCQLVTKQDKPAIRDLYHRSSQLMAVVLLPATVVLVLFSRELVLAWTRNPSIVEHTWLIIVAIAVGTTLNGLMYIPSALQLAEGWTSLAFWMNLVALVIMVPAIVLASLWYGTVGAAAIWTLLNFGCVIVGIQLMHRRLLKNEQWRWYWDATLRPLLASVLAVLPFRLVWPGPMGRVETVAWLLTAEAVATVCATLATPLVRAQAMGFLARWRVAR